MQFSSTKPVPDADRAATTATSPPPAPPPSPATSPPTCQNHGGLQPSVVLTSRQVGLTGGAQLTRLHSAVRNSTRSEVGGKHVVPLQT